MANTKNRRLSPEKRQKVYQDWLMQTYPALFNEQFIPMPIGIFEQLSVNMPTDISKTDLRTMLGWYASRLKYLNHVISHENRLNLDGSIASSITDEEKAAAAQKIKTMLQAKKASEKKLSAVD